MLVNQTDKKTLRTLLNKKDHQELLERTIASCALKSGTLEASEITSILNSFSALLKPDTQVEAPKQDQAV